MARYIYRIDRRFLTKEEKEERVRIYNEWNIYNPVDVNEFIAKELYDDTIVFECMDCHGKETFDFDDVKEFFFKRRKSYSFL